MKTMIDLLNANENIVGLNINTSKTNIMSIGTGRAAFTLNGIPVESFDSFKHLGSQISTDGEAIEVVEFRIRKGAVHIAEKHLTLK